MNKFEKFINKSFISYIQLFFQIEKIFRFKICKDILLLNFLFCYNYYFQLKKNKYHFKNYEFLLFQLYDN